jgi:hypothetical protein
MKVPIIFADGLPGSPVVCRSSASAKLGEIICTDPQGNLQILSICIIRGENLPRSQGNLHAVSISKSRGIICRHQKISLQSERV